MLGVVDADERDVVDLVDHVLQARNRRLELARQVGVLRLADIAADDLVDRRRGVEHLVDRLPGQRRAEHHPRAVAARLGGLQADRVQPLPDLGHVLDLDPVVLQVLAVGDVGGIAGEFGGDLAQRAQRGRRQGATVAAHPQHEVLGLKDVDVLVAGPGAVVALLTLGVEAPPAETAAQVAFVDAVEAAVGVDVFDAGPNVERVVVLLGLFVGVERLAIAQRPLAFASPLGGTCHTGAPLRRSRRWDRARPPVAVRRRRSGGQLEVQVGRSTTSRQTATAANALEVDMPPRHQRDAVIEAAGGGHVANCATHTDTRAPPGQISAHSEQKWRHDRRWETGWHDGQRRAG